LELGRINPRTTDERSRNLSAHAEARKTRRRESMMELDDMMGAIVDAATLKEGLRRIVNNLFPSASPRLRVNWR